MTDLQLSILLESMKDQPSELLKNLATIRIIEPTFNPNLPRRDVIPQHTCRAHIKAMLACNARGLEKYSCLGTSVKQLTQRS